jgi:hypothetical protein
MPAGIAVNLVIGNRSVAQEDARDLGHMIASADEEVTMVAQESNEKVFALSAASMGT